MSRLVEIPGGTATVRTPDEITERQRRRIQRILYGSLGDSLGEVDPNDTENVKVKVTGEFLNSMSELRDAAIIVGLISWTLDRELPTEETLLDLPVPLYQALADAVEGLTGGGGVDFSPTPDQSSPTQPSSDWSGRSGASVTQTVTWPTGGANTNTANSTD